MANGNGTVRQRILGRRLRRLRDGAGYTLEGAAAALEVSLSRLSRIETAQQSVDVHLVKSMLDLYDIGGDQWTETLELVREARRRQWWQAYQIGDSTYVGYEAEAVQVQEYAAGFVPGLLQVAAYSRALFDAIAVARTPSRRDAEIEVRMLRQRRLRDPDDPLAFVAVVDEAALRNPVGGPEVLRGQLAHLVEAAALPTVTLQVLPACSGAHASLASGFLVLSFGDLGEPDMAYVEHALGAAHVEGEQGVRVARTQFDQLRSMALRPADSSALLREIAAAI